MIKRTQDYRIVNRLKGNWRVVVSSEFFYLVETNAKGEALGLWSLHRHRDGVMIHADMGPKCRGRKAIDSAKSAFKWIFRNTNFRKIYAGIPKENRPACRVASLAGMSNMRHYDPAANNDYLLHNTRWFEMNKELSHG